MHHQRALGEEGKLRLLADESLRSFCAFPPVFIHLRAPDSCQSDDKSAPRIREPADRWKYEKRASEGGKVGSLGMPSGRNECPAALEHRVPPLFRHPATVPDLHSFR